MVQDIFLYDEFKKRTRPPGDAHGLTYDQKFALIVKNANAVSIAAGVRGLLYVYPSVFGLRIMRQVEGQDAKDFLAIEYDDANEDRRDGSWGPYEYLSEALKSLPACIAEHIGEEDQELLMDYFRRDRMPAPEA